MFRPIAEFLLEFVATPWGPFVLVTHAFFESFILPVAHELFLIPVCIARPRLSFLFALMSTVASTLGISVGYGIGRWGGRSILAWVLKPKYLDAAERQIHRYDVWAVAIACFTPIPVKIFAILAGSMRLRFKRLFVVAFLSRGTRFFLESLLIFFYGEVARRWILDYIDWILIVILIIAVVSAFVWAHFVRMNHLKESASGVNEA